MAKARTRTGGKGPARRGVPVQRRSLPDVRFQRGQRAATIGLSSWDEDTLSFEGVLASETPCREYRCSPDGWDLIEIDEVLSMEGIRDVDKLVGAPLLNMHSSYSLQSVVGVIEAARVEGTQLIIRARLWDRPDLADIIDGVREGILRNMSVGFSRSQETVEEREGQCPLVTVTEWQPAEGSIVAVPADPTAQIRAARAKPTPKGARRQPASTKRTAAMATRKPTLAELQENLKRARAAVEAKRKAVGKSARKKRDDDDTTSQDDDADGERDGDSDEDADGERDGDAEDQDGDTDGERDGEDADGERDGDDEDGDDPDADEKKRKRSAVIRGLRAVAQRRGKTALATFDAIRAAGGSVSELRAVAMSAVRSAGPISSTSTGSRTPGSGAAKPQLRSFNETAVGKRNKR